MPSAWNDTDRVFLDTNILAHSVDIRDQQRHPIAFNIVTSLIRRKCGVCSTHVLQEFVWVALRKIQLSAYRTKDALDLLAEGLRVVPMSPGLIRNAIDHHERYQLQFWDALLIAAAERARCPIMLTEDLNHGQQYGTVLVQNPFLESPA